MTMAARAATVFTGKSSSKVLLRLIADNIEKNLLQIRLMLRDQVVNPAFDFQLPLVDDGDAVADGLHFAQFVGGEENGFAFVFEALDDFAHLHAAQRVQAAGGFVQNEKLGVVNEGLRQADALLHAFGVGFDLTFAGRFQLDQLEQRINPPSSFGTGNAKNAGIKSEQLFGSEEFVVIGQLGQIADPLPRNRLAHVDSEETRLAAGRVNKTQQHIHGCCLAGAVGAKEPEHFPCPNAQVEVLDGDLSVRAGEVFGFLGPNGAGKTTTMNVLLGFVNATSGEARLFGVNVREPIARQRIGYLPELTYYYKFLTAEELLRLYARIFGIARPEAGRRIDALLKLVELEPARKRQIKTYSKGMLQRVGLAQALLNDPELLILDEPTSGLDPVARREVRDLIVELRDAGVTGRDRDRTDRGGCPRGWSIAEQRAEAAVAGARSRGTRWRRTLPGFER